MKRSCRCRREVRQPFGRGLPCPSCRRERRSTGDEGFTLIELLIVTAVIPLIVGALAAGLFAIFTLQTSTSSRIADSSDAQVVQTNFESDVQGAQQVEIAPTPACVSPNDPAGTQQLLGMEWNLQAGAVGSGESSNYGNVVSYVEVASGSQNNLVRQSCVYTFGSTPTSSETDTILAYDLPASESPATITCISSYTAAQCGADTTTWISTSDVSSVALGIIEPDSKFSYSLTAAPLATSTENDPGGPINDNATTGCNFPQAGSGPLASSLCMIDFSNLLGNPTLLADAEAPEPACLEESIALSGGFTLYFCINIQNSVSGEIIQPFALPTYCQAFLGNPGTSAACGSTGIYPNYYDIPGDPAIYQQGVGGVNNGGVTTITMTGIEIVNGEGVPATGWELFSADAESTDAGSGTNTSLAESVTWNSNADISVVSNGYTAAAGFCKAGTPCDTATDPAGTACYAGGSWTFNGTTYYGIAANSSDTEDYYNGGSPVTTNTVECTVPPTAANVTEEGTLTGALMVEAPTPTTFTATLGDGNGGLEAVVFGLLSS
jgi:prepilin-type N-terminal cleavage/methylation domain-containing protein